MLLALLLTSQGHAELPPPDEPVDFSKIPYEMVRIPAGEFIMGGAEGLSIERPPHQVVITYDYYMGIYEVDQLLFSVVMGFNPIKYHGIECEGRKLAPRANEPAYCISWFEAVRFANRLSRRDGLEQCYEVRDGMLYWPKGLECEGYRLPTEAEWEYAARSNTSYTYSGSSDAESIAWYWENSDKRVHTVGKKTPNEFGVFDMSGNVWEWCWDWYGPYPDRKLFDPTGPRYGGGKVFRGGSWFSQPGIIRAAYRHQLGPDARLGSIGLRLVRSLE